MPLFVKNIPFGFVVIGQKDCPLSRGLIPCFLTCACDDNSRCNASTLFL